MPKLNLTQLCLLYQDVKARKHCASPVVVKSLQWSCPPWQFDSRALVQCRVRIASMLSQLPDAALQSRGGDGIPWCSVVKCRNNRQWGYLEDADKLLAIARAAGMVAVHTPVTDCDLPYIVVLDREIRQRERLRPKEEQNRSMLYWKFILKSE